MSDFTCDLNCPAKHLIVSCCKHCGISKGEYRTPSNEHLWTDDLGFWGPDGCKLSRSEMPAECKQFDCKEHQWVVLREWGGDEWKDLEMYEIKTGYKFGWYCCNR